MFFCRLSLIYKIYHCVNINYNYDYNPIIIIILFICLKFFCEFFLWTVPSKFMASGLACSINTFFTFSISENGHYLYTGSC